MPKRARAPETIADGRRRLVAAQARRTELRVARETAELVSAREVERRWSRLVVDTKNRLLGLPTRAKGKLPHLTTADVAELDRLIREALEELAAARPTEAGA